MQPIPDSVLPTTPFAHHEKQRQRQKATYYNWEWPRENNRKNTRGRRTQYIRMVEWKDGKFFTWTKCIKHQSK